MIRPRTFGGASVLAMAVAVGSPACGDSERPPVWSGERDAGGDAHDGAPELLLDACAGGLIEAAPIPLDLYVMLDISASMLDPTQTGISKWDAVSSALTEFVTNPGSAGLGVGIQYFPLERPGTPDACSSNEDCGESGPCYLKLCWNSAALSACGTDEDCRGQGPCLPLAVCAEDERYICREPGTECLDSGQSYGTCTLATESVCVHATSCMVSDYASPAVAIGTLPDSATDLVASIEDQSPDGNTPTGPALAGALEVAGLRASEHPDRSAAAVLVTDGLPTECDPVSIGEVADLAGAGLADTPRVPTFVIGVFGPADVLSRQNLETIARAGGTSPFLVDTSEDVASQLLEALERIRETRLSCEFRVPEAPSGEALDYSAVNVQVSTTARKKLLYYVPGASDCGTAGGWHYDVDPALAAPTKVVLCEDTCEDLQGYADAAVELGLGCSTIVR
jgi:hypothetical protein